MRIKRAAQLIETGEFNMTQISYMVGINDKKAETAERYLFNETSKEIKLQEAPITDRLSPDTLTLA